jgi:hypothetical protein
MTNCFRCLACGSPDFGRIERVEVSENGTVVAIHADAVLRCTSCGALVEISEDGTIRATGASAGTR